MKHQYLLSYNFQEADGRTGSSSAVYNTHPGPMTLKDYNNIATEIMESHGYTGFAVINIFEFAPAAEEEVEA